MANDDKLQDQSNEPQTAESNAERDRDAGNMNYGTIGGSMHADDSDDKNAKQPGKKAADAATGQTDNG